MSTDVMYKNIVLFKTRPSKRKHTVECKYCNSSLTHRLPNPADIWKGNVKTDVML